MSELKEGESIPLSTVVLPEGVELVGDPERIVVSAVTLKRAVLEAEAADTAAEGSEAAEPSDASQGAASAESKS